MAAVADLRPKRFDGAFHVQVRADDLADGRLIRSLQIIGVEEVLLGAESFDDRLLRSNRKGFMVKHVLAALGHLRTAGIRVALSVVLGLPGEDHLSLRRTVQNCKRLMHQHNIAEMHASITTPLPGSSLWISLLRFPELHRKYTEKDVIPHEEVLADYVPRFTSCGMKQLMEAYATIDNMFPSAGPFYLSSHSPAAQQLGYRGLI